MKKFLILFTFLFLTSCSHKGDPLYGYNKTMFTINEGLNQVIIFPATKAYKFVLPQPIKSGISNFFSNLRQPVYMVHNLLQADFDGAGNNFEKFFINSLIGVGGLFDIAGKEGIETHKEDFGQTFAVWGASDGPYIVLPIIGPSNLRDSVGLVGDIFTDPINVWARNTDKKYIAYQRAVLEGLSNLEPNIETLENLRKTSPDLYATIKTVYEQKRADDIADGEISDNLDEYYPSEYEFLN